MQANDANQRAAFRVSEMLVARPDLAPALLAVLTEFFRAEREHPTWGTDAAHALGFLAEEFGEVAKAINEFNTTGDARWLEEALGESAQVGAVGLRIVAHIQAGGFVPAGGE